MANKKKKIHRFIARDQRLDRWKEDRRAGKSPEELKEYYIDKEASLSWLKEERLDLMVR